MNAYLSNGKKQMIGGGGIVGKMMVMVMAITSFMKGSGPPDLAAWHLHKCRCLLRHHQPPIAREIINTSVALN